MSTGRHTVLVVGDAADPHVEAVTTSLSRREVTAFVCGPVDICASTGLSFEYDSFGVSGTLRVNGSSCALADIVSVWWRVKQSVNLPTQQSRSLAHAFAAREWLSVFDSLATLTLTAFWVNRREADFLARNKPLQLRVAAECGLPIPRTLISNRPAEVVDFIERCHNDCIYKPVTWYYEPPNKMVFTSAVTAHQVATNAEELALAPGIFQQRVAKAYEIRATVVDTQIFAVKIDSQARQETALDWRRNQDDLHYEPMDLDSATAKQIRRLHKRLGLRFAAYDLVVTPSGEPVFLEANPVGQWLWLERKMDLPVSEALADMLARGAGRPRARGGTAASLTT